MRIYLKKKMTNMLKEVIETQSSLIDSLNRDYEKSNYMNYDDAYICYIENIFTKCQQLAIEIGTKIEEVEKKETQAVHILEEYCEEVYLANNLFKANKIYETINKLVKMNECLEKIIEKIKRELSEDKIEILFLPYKASMWDSLESIWLAAKEDLNCNVHVVPIPYYDKNSDGSFKKMYYEGNQYPSYVPIIDWKTINLEELHPDIIYFHNPYDNYNYLTSVEPRFYSSELKKHTEMLVYIPYFVSGNTLEKHLCRAIGIFHSTKVIVESEDIKKIYINEYIEALGAEQKELEKKGSPRNHIFWSALKKQADEKFLALGSPKFDKVLNTKINLEEIPEEWQKILKKKTEIKKIVLYNTSIKALLDYREEYLIKIKNVLEIFEKSKDTLLLWRPHPLMRATIESIGEDIAIKYEKIINDFKDKEIGIYDDTSELDRSISISDAYYGDMSSLVPLCQSLNMPILIQNVRLLEEEI